MQTAGDVYHGKHLPPSWRTLYDLTERFPWGGWARTNSVSLCQPIPRENAQTCFCLYSESADPELGKVIPFGVFDMNRNEGCVSVGIDHNTAVRSAGHRPLEVEDGPQTLFPRLGVVDHRRRRGKQ